MPSRFSCVVAAVSASFLFMLNRTQWTTFSLSIHPLVDTGLFHLFGCRGHECASRDSGTCTLVLTAALAETQISLLFWPHHVAWGIQFPDQRSNLSPLHWKHGVLTTGPPGNPPGVFFFQCGFGQLKKQTQACRSDQRAGFHPGAQPCWSQSLVACLEFSVAPTQPPRLSFSAQKPNLSSQNSLQPQSAPEGRADPTAGAVCWVSVCGAPAPKPRLPSAGESTRTLVFRGPLSQAPCACALSCVASDPGTLFPRLLVVSPARPLEPGSESPPQGSRMAGPGHPQSHPPELLFCGHVACGVFHP